MINSTHINEQDLQAWTVFDERSNVSDIGKARIPHDYLELHQVREAKLRLSKTSIANLGSQALIIHTQQE